MSVNSDLLHTHPLHLGLSTGTLKVATMVAGTETVVWEMSGDQGKLWKRESVTVNSDQDFRVN